MKMVRSHSIRVSKTARYFTLGTLTEKTKTFWFIFHGYGQLAKEFLDEFEILNNSSNFIVAPEALNKFYLRGFAGKIGSTWMTKEDRENEINDYVKMIDKIFISYKSNIRSQNIKVNLLGFSQGAHTAVRWLNKYGYKIDNLILWGASFPHDCNYNNSYWSRVKPKIIIGNQDIFLSKRKLKKEKMYLKSQNINFNIYRFNGEHEIDEKMLLKLANE